jgi:hypothetical protein
LNLCSTLSHVTTWLLSYAFRRRAYPGVCAAVLAEFSGLLLRVRLVPLYVKKIICVGSSLGNVTEMPLRAAVLFWCCIASHWYVVRETVNQLSSRRLWGTAGAVAAVTLLGLELLVCPWVAHSYLNKWSN